MKKWILAMIILLMWPATAMAHSHMETSLPEDGATVIEPLKEVVLTFSAGIEEGSALTLTGAEEEVEFTEVKIEDSKITGILAEPLPDGRWTLGWNVISEDGHPIEGEVNFEAASGISQEEEVNEESAEEEEGSGANSEEDELPMTEEEPEDQDTAQDQQEEGNNTLLTVGLIVVVLILLGLVFMALRKKK